MQYIAQYTANKSLTSDVDEVIRELSTDGFYRTHPNLGSTIIFGEHSGIDEFHHLYIKFLKNREPEASYMDEFWGHWLHYTHMRKILPGLNFSSNENKDFITTYLACSCNFVGIIRTKDDKIILAVDSRRHGIPRLADPFKQHNPIRVMVYHTQAYAHTWHEKGLKGNTPDTPY